MTMMMVAAAVVMVVVVVVVTIMMMMLIMIFKDKLPVFLEKNVTYHIISYHIISYHIISYCDAVQHLLRSQCAALQDSPMK